MSTEKVAIVTGSNKGIGYAIVKGLCEKFDGVVYLTSRDVERGQKAIQQLNELNLKPKFHQLDIDDQQSVDKFQEYIKNTYGGVDILVNNAAIAYKNDAKDPFSEQAEETIKTNYFGTARMCDAFFPIIRENGNVVNVSSSAGLLMRIPSSELRTKFISEQLTIPALNDLMLQFVNDAKNGVHEAKGWGKSAYVVSKVGVSALTRIQQKNFEKERPDCKIKVNSVHPGYVDTDMTSHKGPLTIEQGASAPLYLATTNHELYGQFVWCDSTHVDWAEHIPQIG